MTSNSILLQKKYARIISGFADRLRISLDSALNFFYKSQLYPLMRDGVSDMHCRSDLYLIEELEMEYKGINPYQA